MTSRDNPGVIVVAVSQRVDPHPDRAETRDALDQRLCAWLRDSACLPIPVPNVLGRNAEAPAGELLSGLRAWLERVRPDAVVLSGGNDLGQFPARDETESRLLNWAFSVGKPVLGICRGMQMMAVWAGGALKKVPGHVRTRHRLVGGITGEANSYHDLALAACPPGFVQLAAAEDGEIEAIRHATLPWEGWMWHPEREAKFAVRDSMRLRELFCK